MDARQFDELRRLLKIYRQDINDRKRHAQQINMDAKLLAHSLDYLTARSNEAYQLIVDIESEIVANA